MTFTEVIEHVAPLARHAVLLLVTMAATWHDAR